MPTYGRLPVSFERGEGSYLFDTDGRRYLDGLCGIAVTNLGHAHPEVAEAIAEQARTLIHTSNLYNIGPQEKLAEKLCDLTGMEKVFFCNSGAESNEAAIKLARLYGHRKGVEKPVIVTLANSFHGRTLAALSATGNDKIKEGFGPMVEGFTRVPRNDVSAIANLPNKESIVAVILEPVQGEGGVFAMDADYLKAVRALCDEQGWLLMFDEVQSGNGRCGAVFAFKRYGVMPDVLTTAKGLGNGVPIGACMAHGVAADVLGPGSHGTTYGGNFIASVAALKVLEVLTRDKLYDNADHIRQVILSAFDANLQNKQVVKEVRGLGLMIGIEVDMPCDKIVKRALELGFLINVTAGNTIRLLPPLNMSDVDAALLGQGVANVIDSLITDME